MAAIPFLDTPPKIKTASYIEKGEHRKSFILFVAYETKSSKPNELVVRCLTYRKFDAVELRVRCDGTFRACRLNFAQLYFEDCFRGYFPVVVRSVAGYVTRRQQGKRPKKD